MIKATKLERLNTPLFQPLTPRDLILVTAANKFTLIGRTGESDGTVVNDYTEE